MPYVEPILRSVPTPEEIAAAQESNWDWSAIGSGLRDLLGGIPGAGSFTVPTGFGPQLTWGPGGEGQPWDSPLSGLYADIAAQMAAAENPPGSYPGRVVGGESARGSASPVSVPPVANPSLIQQQAGYDYFTNLDAERAAATGGSGTGSGGLSAYESQQRELTRLFDQLELEQSLKDIKGRYRPELKQSAAKIEETQGKAAKDSGIYTRLLKEVVPSFRGAGRLAAVNLERAKAAAAETNAARRAEIDRSFESATGRARAMVLAVSGDAPEQVDALTAGMDDLNAFVDAGMAREEKGQRMLMEASAELARSAAYYGLAAAQGEVVQEREKTRIQYENTINDMLAERQAMLDARRAALDSAREWYALETARRDAQWALSDAARGGGQGGSGTAAGTFDPSYLDVTQEQYITRTLSYALTAAGITSTVEGDRAVTEILDMLDMNITPAEALRLAADIAADPEAYNGDQQAFAAWVNSVGETNLTVLYGAAADSQSDFERGSQWGTSDQWLFRQAYSAAELGGAMDPTQYATDLVNGLYGDPYEELRSQGFVPARAPAPQAGVRGQRPTGTASTLLAGLPTPTVGGP